MRNHEEIYNAAEVYDIAFGFREVDKECGFLKALFEKNNKKKIKSFLELGAGPAVHTVEMAKAKIRAAALDLSQSMVEYGLKKAKSLDVEITYTQGDMIEFDLDTRFDMAVLLMNSASYLFTNQDVYRHFKSVARHLNEGGLYILEMDHPKYIFGTEGMAVHNFVSDWEMERNGKKVHFQWGAENDAFDPITQIRDVTNIATVTHGDETNVILDQAPCRCFNANEFLALVDASECFRVVDLFGAVDGDIPFDNSKEAWRMVPVLQKV